MPWPKGRKRPEQRERMRALHADPEFKARQRKAASERMRALNADPEFKARQSERMRALQSTRWHCPPGYERIYRKLLAAGLGVTAARAQIDDLARKDAPAEAAE